MTNQPQSPSPCPSNPAAKILDALLASHDAQLRTQATRHAPDPDAAEDAFQDGCVEFLRYYQGPPGRDALRYLMLAVKQRAWAIRRERCSRSHPDLHSVDDPEALAVPDDRPGPAVLAEHREQHVQRCAALDCLTPDQRSALVLFAAGYSYAEIGALRNWSYSKVNHAIAEGRAALRATAPLA